ncbi:MAG: 2TM domain-containing protein [Actinomycetota bacterium]
MTTPLEAPSPDHRSTEAEATHARQVRAFQAHAGVAAVSLTFMLAVNLLTNLWVGSTGHIEAWWSLWSFVGWFPGLGIHGLVVWLAADQARHDR